MSVLEKLAGEVLTREDKSITVISVSPTTETQTPNYASMDVRSSFEPEVCTAMCSKSVGMH